MLNLQVKDAEPLSEYAYQHMETMGDRIRMLRDAKGLSQEQLGKLVGVTKSAVSQWENGTTQNIKLEEFLTLVDVLGTKPHYLVYGAERGPSPGSRRAGGRI
jgi:repressor LexA